MSGYEEFDYSKPFSIKVWSRMLPYVRRQRKSVWIIVLTMLFCAGADVFYPLLLQYTIDHMIVPRSAARLPAVAAAMAAVVILQGLSVLLFVRAGMRVEFTIGLELRRDLFSRLQELSLSYYSVTPVGYIMARVMSDTSKIGDIIAWSLVDVMWAFAYILGVFAAMFALNWRLALLVAAIVPPLALLTWYFQRKLLRVNREARRINSQITGAFNEGITGARTSKTMAIEDKNTLEFSGRTESMYRKSSMLALLGAVYWPLILLTGSLSTAAVIRTGGGMVAAGAIEFGMLAAFINYTMGVFEPIQQIARVFTNFVASQANIERVFTLLDQKPDITDSPEVIRKYGDAFSPKKENWEPIRGDVEFRGVTFRYPDGEENVLERFSLKVPAGSVIAIVGETGAGKSTLVNLLCRFFEPTEGQVLIDGRDVRERSQLWLRSNIGYVLQNPHLFSGTVRDNIRYGRLEATDEEILAAARLVSADRLIDRLENGMDTEVGEGGDRLSTGEKQLVSFARAVLADPRIFVLDEATSSVDTETEMLIQQAISQMLKGRTAFIIAHRLSTIRGADRILVMKDGKIVEQGRHDELMSKRGVYFELYTRHLEEETEKTAFGGHGLRGEKERGNIISAE